MSSTARQAPPESLPSWLAPVLHAPFLVSLVSVLPHVACSHSCRLHIPPTAPRHRARPQPLLTARPRTRPSTSISPRCRRPGLPVQTIAGPHDPGTTAVHSCAAWNSWWPSRLSASFPALPPGGPLPPTRREPSLDAAGPWGLAQAAPSPRTPRPTPNETLPNPVCVRTGPSTSSSGGPGGFHVERSRGCPGPPHPAPSTRPLIPDARVVIPDTRQGHRSRVL